jgi:hypothetical protein
LKIIKRGTILLGVLLALIQVVRPARTNPPVDESRTIQALTRMTPEVAAIFERSCKDCHSYRTQWPWYSQVAPVSWYVVSDVNEGRDHLILSDWARYDRKKALKRLDDICDEVGDGDMPPWPYVLIHSTARLSDADKSVLCNWTNEERRRIESGPAGTAQ